ncbi:hypothetical protein OG455_31675 [Kitasatospora sp. NBC_01287]|uniref:hypothetical protein n=1 Tax=Kitasatospora sp. NBC_01287 TaxID=2903573 RepID=UPI002250C40E|nr:hypothetical protein [Kitasatospora sp. NBC_01287]MCX4750026.1 hypothetical protein [Kitasatospora sp. NBC_01287]
MDLSETLSAMPAAEPFAALPDAWHWSPNPRFHFVAAPAADGKHALQVTTLGPFEPGLVALLLAAARAHTDQLLGDPRPLIALPGFGAPGHEFDTAAVAAPRGHTLHARDNAELHALTYAVFPGWHYEFSGTETDEEALFQVSHPQGLRATSLDRQPSPFLRMRFDNPRTKGGSSGPDRGLAKPDMLFRELELLEGVPGAFVEFENFRHQVWRAAWADGFTLTGEGGHRELDRDGLLRFAESSLT